MLKSGGSCLSDNVFIVHQLDKSVLKMYSYFIVPLYFGGSRGLMDRVGLVTQRFRVRVSVPAGIVGGWSECPELSTLSKGP